MKVKHFSTLNEAKRFIDDPKVLCKVFEIFDGIDHVGIGLDPQGYFIQVIQTWNLGPMLEQEDAAKYMGLKLAFGRPDLIEQIPQEFHREPLIKGIKKDSSTTINPGMEIFGGGALGAIVYKNQEEHLLSCEHVLRDLENGITLNDLEWENIVIAKNVKSGGTCLDCAIAKFENDYLKQIENEILGIGYAPKISLPPVLHKKVVKYGPATGRKFGYIRLVHVRKTIDQKFKYFEVQPLTAIDGSFALEGDSGSMILSNSNRQNVFGMIFRQVTFDLCGRVNSPFDVNRGGLCIDMEDIIDFLNISLTK